MEIVSKPLPYKPIQTDVPPLLNQALAQWLEPAADGA